MHELGAVSAPTSCPRGATFRLALACGTLVARTETKSPTGDVQTLRLRMEGGLSGRRHTFPLTKGADLA